MHAPKTLEQKSSSPSYVTMNASESESGQSTLGNPNSSDEKLKAMIAYHSTFRVLPLPPFDIAEMILENRTPTIGNCKDPEVVNRRWPPANRRHVI